MVNFTISKSKVDEKNYDVCTWVESFYGKTVPVPVNLQKFKITKQNVKL